MESYKKQFLELSLKFGALRFGEFTLKSGRVSPYFFNAGLLNTGQAAAKLGRCYALALATMDLKYDMMFGLAYKAIPLVALTAAALADHHDMDYPFAYNRKEAKDHGEGGATIGAPLQGRVLILDDVITAGTTIKEAISIIRGAGGTPSSILVALDREEVGNDSRMPAVRELEEELSLPIRSIISLGDLVNYLKEGREFSEYLPAVQAYRNRYGVTP